MQAVARRSPRVALVTYNRAPDLAPDDQALVPALSRVGIEARAAVWSDGDVDWSSYDGIVIRSCWDYHLRSSEFRRWLDELDARGSLVFNSTTLVRWNADKRYLLELAAAGVPTLPTRVVPPGDVDAVRTTLDAEGWTRAVIKPAISASGFETHALRVPLDSEALARIRDATAAGATLLQPFADEIPRDGELSFSFIDGSFSHATIKRAAAGEFRVQTEHGGSVRAIVPAPALVRDAERVMGFLAEPPLYARVDGIARDGRFVLMEIELIEPNLFLEYGDGAAGRFADAIARRLMIGEMK